MLVCTYTLHYLHCLSLCLSCLFPPSPGPPHVTTPETSRNSMDLTRIYSNILILSISAHTFIKGLTFLSVSRLADTRHTIANKCDHVIMTKYISQIVVADNWRLVKPCRSTSVITIHDTTTPTPPPIIPNVLKIKSRNLYSLYGTSHLILSRTS